jgi:Ca2+-binding EF-hand superfamily protein
MKTLNCLFLSAAVLTATALSAQTGPAGGPRGGGRGGPHGPSRGNPVVRALDTDQNREISAAELANASAALLTLDTDKDGALSAAELHPVPPAPPADAPARPERPARPAFDASRPHPVDPVMLALDANSDGALSAAEIASAAKSLAALDVNHDGKLTLDELHPLPPKAE